MLKDGVVEQEIEPGHRGRGGFVYTIDANSRYELQVNAGGQELSTTLQGQGAYGNVGVWLKQGAVLTDTDALEIEIHSNEMLGDRDKLHVRLRAKNSVVVEETVSKSEFRVWSSPAAGNVDVFTIRIAAEDVYEFSSAGGIYVLSIENSNSWNSLLYERLIFVMPQVRFAEQAVTIDSNADEYAPGDMVDLQVTINTDQLGNFDSEEDLYASVTVTDISSLLSVPSHKLQPSLPTMVYLEKEVKLVGNDWALTDSLEYSDEFIDTNFNLDETDNTDDYLNLELLLGVQSWRRRVFTTYDWVAYETQNFLITEPMACYVPWEYDYYDDWIMEDAWIEPMRFDEEPMIMEMEMAFEEDM